MDETRLAYYDRYGFPDFFAPVTRAPEAMMDQVRAIPGVATAESRLTAGGIIDVPEIVEPVTARLHSVPMTGRSRLNALVLQSGRWVDPRRPDEALASSNFATAAGVALGDRLKVTVRGKQMSLRIVGTVSSPEYVYAIAPGQFFPDNRRYGILWMGRDALAGALDMRGAFNDVLGRLQPGVDVADVTRRLDLLLARYGGVAAYGRDQHISDRFVVNELSQLRTMTNFLPPIFLGVAAFLLNILLARLVETERDVVGLLKAFGYRNWTIALHYAQLALLLSLSGLLLGVGLGIWAGHALAELYREFFAFPFLTFGIGADVYGIAVFAALAAVLLGAGSAVMRALRLTPAEAMRMPTPPSYGGIVSRWMAKWRRLDEPTRIIFRDLVRQPWRSSLTVAGIAAALGLYIASAGAMDNIERLIDIAYGQANREDVSITFAEARDERAIWELARIKGVQRVEASRNVAARLRTGRIVERQGLSGMEPGADLTRVVDMSGTAVPPPEDGLIASSTLARKMGFERGALLDIDISEGRQAKLRLPVLGIIDTPIGSPAFLTRASLNRALHEGPVVSGASLAIDPLERDHIYRQLKRAPMVVGLASRQTAIDGIRDTVGRSMGTVTLVYAAFAMMVVFGVTYNSGRIMLSERARDLASLRVLGYRRGEVAYVLIGSLLVITLVATPLGIGFGVALARMLMERFSGDLFIIPFGLQPATVARGVLILLVAVGITALLLKNRIDRLDLVEVLKTRE
jgi:putative ABC transport system permease protein